MSHRAVKGKGGVSSIMACESEDRLNVSDVAPTLDDVLQPLFERDAWFDRLLSDCCADQRAVVIDGMVGDSLCRLHLMERAPGHLISLANWYSFRWLPQFKQADPAARRPTLIRAWRAARSHAHRLDLSPIPAEGGAAAEISETLRAAGWHVAMTMISRSHWLYTGGRSFDSWWEARPSRLRSTVARKAKKNTVSLAVHSAFSDSLWDEYEAVYRASWKPAEPCPEFLRDWARVASNQGALRLGIARIDDAPVAAQFWTVDAGVASIHKLAQIADPAAEAHSPGTLLTHALFAHAFDVDRVQRIDFGTGDDGYKRDWMEQSADLMRITATDLHQATAWISIAQHGLSRVAARLRGR